VARLCAANDIEPGAHLDAMAAAFREVPPRAVYITAETGLATEAEALHSRLLAGSLLVNQS
jgi:hypothetical protein